MGTLLRPHLHLALLIKPGFGFGVAMGSVSLTSPE